MWPIKLKSKEGGDVDEADAHSMESKMCGNLVWEIMMKVPTSSMIALAGDLHLLS